MRLRLRHQPGELLFDELTVEAELGSGAYGTVYRCRDGEGTLKAVKELHVVEAADRAQALLYFRREADHLAHLDHRGLPHATAVDLEGPFAIDPASGLELPAPGAESLTVARRHYLVMDFISGESLETLAQRWRPQAEEVGELLGWVHQIGAVLTYLHDQGLVHRDVKPANILIRDDDRTAVLIDFGLCREAVAAGGYGTVPMSGSGRFGTPGYAPPDPVEQENPQPLADQYALAMSLRRVLTGLDPTDIEQLADIRRRMTELRPDLEPHVAAALDRAIRPTAEERFGTVGRFVAALESPPATLANPSRIPWIELLPADLRIGAVAPGQLVDLSLTIRDRRPGVRPMGEVESKDDHLRILPPTVHGSDVILHLLLKIPRHASIGYVRTLLVVRANNEEHLVPVSYDVDPTARAGRSLSRAGCLMLPVSWLKSGR